MASPATTRTSLRLATTTAPDRGRVSDRPEPGRQPEHRKGNRAGVRHAAGWLFVSWVLTVSGAYLYYMLRGIFG